MLINKEFSIGAIVFRKKDTEIQFLLVYSNRNKIWGFPKGHIEPGEKELETALREIREEAGLRDLKVIEGFREEDIYEAVSNRGESKGKLIEKHSLYFLCKAKQNDVKVDGTEVTDYCWLNLEEAMKLLSFESQKKILKKAEAKIK